NVPSWDPPPQFAGTHRRSRRGCRTLRSLHRVSFPTPNWSPRACLPRSFGNKQICHYNMQVSNSCVIEVRVADAPLITTAQAPGQQLAIRPQPVAQLCARPSRLRARSPFVVDGRHLPRQVAPGCKWTGPAQTYGSIQIDLVELGRIVANDLARHVFRHA